MICGVQGMRALHLHQPVMAAVEHDDRRVLDLTTAMEKGHGDAFSDFHDRYCDRLYGFLLMLARGDETAARDILQVALVKAATKIRPFTTERSLWAWLCQIAKNSWIDHVRTAKTAGKVVSVDFQESAQTAACDGPDPFVELIDIALEHLDDDEREMVSAFYFEEASYKDLAIRMGITAKAVESRLGRIRLKIKQIILAQLK